MNADSPLTPMAMALLLTLAAGGVWSWQRGIAKGTRDEIKPEAWELVTQQYPTDETVRDAPALSSQMLDKAVQANPFSSSRRAAAAQARTTGAAAGPSAGLPPAPQFVYKGRINMGTRTRAILEDAAVKKTYFLEVGQEVTGFKVLDIEENRVVLSDAESNKEVVLSLAQPEVKP